MTCIKKILSGIFFCFCSVYSGEVSVIASADLHGELESFARLAPVIKNYPQAVKADIGDLIQGGYAASYLRGIPMFDALNLLGYEIFVPGNHEFEFESRIFESWRQKFCGRIIGVQWKFGDFEPEKYAVITRNGYRIGFIGATDSGLFARQGFYPRLQFTDTVAALKHSVAQLRRENVDAVVLLCHIALQGNYGMIYKMLQEVPEINAVISCHSHQEHPGEIIAGRLVAQPGAYGSSAVLLKLHFDTEKKLKFVTSSLLRPSKEADAGVMNILYDAEKSVPAGCIRKKFSDVQSFGVAAARALRRGCGSDAAVCRVAKEFFQEEIDEKILFRMMPYGNRMMVVKADTAALREFVRRRSNKKYHCFVDIAPGAGDVLTIAVPDYLLWSDPEWKKLDRRALSLFERETILKSLEKSCRGTIL